MKLFYLLLFLLLHMPFNHMQGQNKDSSCVILLRNHSFEKGIVHILRVLTIFTEKSIFDKDTLIGNRLFYKKTVSNHPNVEYWHEAEDGSIWWYQPTFFAQEVLFIPKEPKLGYTIISNRCQMTIVGINETRKFGTKSFGEREFSNLIVCEIIDFQTGRKYNRFFKKGVGWVAAESEWGLTYLECVEYQNR